ncbi:MAG: holo-ACP synthase [Parachlamydiales bacterium]|nr:holo-ACP synthase [Parachlamydiales bacterium]
MKKDTSIYGLGNDIIEIERIRQSIERHGQHFLDRLFSHKEQEHCLKFKDPAPHFAGRFAAKEAIAKALGTGFGSELSWHDLEILGDDHGKPVVHISQEAKKRFNNPNLLVSISHSASHATAVAIWC